MLIKWIKHALAHSFQLDIRSSFYSTSGGIWRVHTELALNGGKNLCARTDNGFSPICEVCDGTVSLPARHGRAIDLEKSVQSKQRAFYYVYRK